MHCIKALTTMQNYIIFLIIELNESVIACLEDLGLSEMIALIKKADLLDTFSNNSSEFTVFAPMNKAIMTSDLLKLNESELETALLAHVLKGVLKSRNFIAKSSLESLARGHYIHIHNTWNWITQVHVCKGCL